MNVLIVAAHPDDEVLGCGGTVARLSREGHTVSVAILGEGLTARCACDEERNVEALGVLHEQARRASDILGVKDVFFDKLPDNRFDTVPLLDVVKLVEGHIETVKPRVVYSHHAGDVNIDHRITAQAVLTATRPMPGGRVRELYAFEVPSSTEWAFTQDDAFVPNVFRDVSGTLGLKLRALDFYKDEMRTFPHARSFEAVRALAQWRGATAGVAAAEAYQLVRAIQ